ncbi:hypothetical protein CKF46_29115 [Klebsiella pneumoniae]|nr:hypothetical protein CKF46_29115 [Klebsiella pneumoniae]
MHPELDALHRGADHQDQRPDAGRFDPVPARGAYQAWTKKEPVGVVAGIVPWNFPLMIGMWKVMPALAAGCSIVIKPSETTPLTLLRVAELATQAGVLTGCSTWSPAAAPAAARR